MHVVPVSHQVVVVAVTRNLKQLAVFLLLVTMGFNAYSLVLPTERADVLYHSYDGGGITVDGPSVLIRKNVGENYSISANHYVDSISSASVDVQMLLGASRYSEERTQNSLGIDYMYDKSIISYSYTNSSENDFEADTMNFSISQEMFGGLTTVSMGFKYGDNLVMMSTDDTFQQQAESRGYRLTVSQVLTKNMLLGVAYEIITDEGFLNNPYRQVRYEDTSQSLNYNFQPEVYPNTRTSNAIGFSLRHYLSNGDAIYGGYRYFLDSWDVEADTFDVGYVYTYDDNWLFEFTYRYYSQSKAEFYNDLFPAINYQNYLARDKELSTHNSHAFGVGASYEFGKQGLGMFERATANFYYTLFMFSYDDFRDVPYGQANNIIGGQEPLYEFDASVIRLYFSFWF